MSEQQDISTIVDYDEATGQSEITADESQDNLPEQASTTVGAAPDSAPSNDLTNVVPPDDDSSSITESLSDNCSRLSSDEPEWLMSPRLNVDEATELNEVAVEESQRYLLEKASTIGSAATHSINSNELTNNALLGEDQDGFTTETINSPEENSGRSDSVSPVTLAVHGYHRFSLLSAYYGEQQDLIMPVATAVVHNEIIVDAIPMAEEIIMVMAHAVYEGITVHATAMEDIDSRTCFERYRPSSRYVKAGFGFLIVVPLLVTIGQILRNQHRSMQNKLIKDIVFNLSTQAMILNPGSPQQRALLWMQGDDNRHLRPSDRRLNIVQRYVMAVLYFSTIGDQWLEKGNFMSSDPECEWQPVVQCSENNANITDLLLGNKSIGGTLPSEIQHLKYLKQLNISNNFIGGALPSEVGTLTELVVFDCQNNYFKGTVPTEVANLKNLCVLDLSDNKMTGSLPFFPWWETVNTTGPSSELQYFLNLFHLNLSHNSFTGTIAPEMGSLAQLEYVDLASNQLRGPLFSRMGDISSMQYLDLSSNQMLTGSIPCEFGKLNNLRHLDISCSQLSGSIPAELQSLAHLEYLDLGQNKINGSTSVLANLKQLYYLSVPSNTFTGGVPSNLERIIYMDLSGNKLSSTIPSMLGNLAHLVTLDLSLNSLYGSIPVELGSLEQLQYLDLGQNKINGSIPSELGNLSSLTSLLLQFNDLSGAIPTQLGRIVQMTELLLHNNSLNGTLPLELMGLQKLSRATFFGNDLWGNISFLCSDFNQNEFPSPRAAIYVDNATKSILNCLCCKLVEETQHFDSHLHQSRQGICMRNDLVF